MAKYFGPKETEVISRLSYEKVTLITKEQFDKLFWGIPFDAPDYLSTQEEGYFETDH